MAADRAGAPPRAWQRMLSGRRLDLLDPSPLDIEISDIAHGLARVARWNGQTFGDHAFSVAQHSLLVETIFCVQQPEASPDQRLATLLHDAPEYVIGDMISPFKAVVGGDYKAVEQRLQRAIHLRFALPPKLAEKTKTAIKRADQVAAYFEATVLAGFATAEAVRYFGRPNGISADRLDLALRPAKTVQAAFLKRFAAIEKERAARAVETVRIPTEAG
ncbi:HD family hydrolase [Mesorhizobium sp. CN2-181]|uniref:HD family hydrolase n=1 Tax=Mesorhizobium yinganensis TaxID=3157707 RepID=UPI0032B8197B